MADYGIPRVSGYRFDFKPFFSPPSYQGSSNSVEWPINASNLGATDYFGNSVSISGNYAIVGAYYEDGTSVSATTNECGAAYIFESDSSGNWTQKQILRASNLGSSDSFGQSVAISGNYAIVGAYYEDGSSTSASFDCGAAYIFERNTSTGLWAEKQILRASNLGTVDQFGNSVAISGNYAIIGASREDGSSNNITDCGAAYIFERNTTTGVWSEKTILRASNLGMTDDFGYSVAISGNYAIIGARYEDGSNTSASFNCGAAYIFERNSSEVWIEKQILRASNLGTTAQFGYSVAISGNYAIVGAYGEDYTNTSTSFDCGAAYIFQRNSSGIWSEQTLLRASNLANGNQFGASVSISGNHAIVGANRAVHPNIGTSDCGAVYVYYRNETTNTWSEQAIYSAYNAETGDSYGSSVAISNNQFIVGAPFENAGALNVSSAGTAYFYWNNYPIYAYDPTPVSFVGNTLTISNTITNNDIDPVSFTLNSGEILSQLRITDLSGVYTYLSYTLKNATTGETIRSGSSINTVGYDLLTGTPLTATGVTPTTYNLTLTSYDTFTYTIVGILDYRTQQLVGYNFSAALNEKMVRASNLGDSDGFGNSVSISGNYAIVGAYQEDGSNTSTTFNSGAAYIFERDGSGNWNETTILRASNFGQGDQFGKSVAIDGNYAIVGAIQENGINNNLIAGAAYIFERDDSGNWTETKILRASNLIADDYFGVSVAISGNYAIVGANLKGLNNSGAAYIFERDTITGIWSEKQILTANNAGANDSFGASVAISGDYAIVGASGEDGPTNNVNNTDSGAAYIFERNTSGQWNQKTQILRTSNNLANISFGTSVAISGTYAIVGATYDDGTGIITANHGAVYIFERNSTTTIWDPKTTLRASNFGELDYFGNSVAISGNYVIVGANEEDGISNQYTNSGAAYIFERNDSGNWIEKNIIRDSNARSFDYFGASVAISGNTILVGANGSSIPSSSIYGNGAAFFYSANPIYTYTPTPLSFVNGTLTITNTIDATDTDVVSFALTAGAKLFPFSVTSFSGTGTISYSLDISGGANVKTGTFSANNFDILTGTALTATGNTTYILTLTANAAIEYTIVGNLLTSPTNIVLSNNSINELQPIGTTIGTLTCDNPNNSSITYSVNDTTRFSITGSTLKTNVIFDFETTSSYAVTITAAIGGLSSSSSKTILVTNIVGEAAELRRQNLQGPALKTAANSQTTPITATELKTAGYNATELKGAIYSATQLKAALFTATQLKDASFNATELKDASFNATELKAALFTAVQLKDASFNATELKDASFNATELKAALFTAAELKTAQFTAVQLKDASFNATELKAALFTATELKNALFTATELKAASFNAIQLKDASFNLIQLKDASFTAAELKDASFTAIQLKDVSFNAVQLKDALFTATELKAALFTATQLKDASFNLIQLKDASFNLIQLKEALFTATELKDASFNATQLKDASFNATELKAALFTATQLKDALFTAAELKTALFNATELKEALFTATELKAALFNATELKAALFTAAELKAALFNAAELKTALFTAAELKAALFTATELKNALFNATELKDALFTAAELKTAQFTVLELKTALFTVNQLKEALFTVGDLSSNFTFEQLKTGGYTALEMKTTFSLDQLIAGQYSVNDLRQAEFTVAELAAKNFTLAQLKTGGYTAAQMKTTFSLNQLITGGYNATELKAAEYTVSELTSKFSFAQLKTGGYTALEMKSIFSLNTLITGGYNATELKAAAYTAAELKSRFTLAQLKIALYTAAEMKAANFSVAQLRAGGYTVAEMTSSYTLAELKAGGFTADEIKTSYTLTELIDGLYTAAELKAAGYSVATLKSTSRFTFEQLKTGGYSADEMKTSYTLTELIDGGFSAVELKAAGYSVADLKTRFTIEQLKNGGYTAAQMKAANFSLDELITGGYNAAELKAAQYSVTDLTGKGFVLNQLKAGGYTVAEMTPTFSLTALKQGGYTAAQMKASNVSLDVLIQLGYTAENLRAAQYTVGDLTGKGFAFNVLKTGGYTADEMDTVFSLDQLVSGGYNASDLRNAGYSVTDLTQKGFTFGDLKTGGYSAAQMTPTFTLDQLVQGVNNVSGYTAAELKVAGYSVAVLKTRFTIEQLRVGGYTVGEMVIENFSLTALKNGGYTAAQMTPTFSLAELISGGYTAEQLRIANFTASQLKNANFTIDQLKTGGYSAAQMKLAPYSATELKNAGYSVAQMKDALYSATELNSIGYTSFQLVDGGFNAASLIILGIVPDWNVIENANCITTSYVQDFVDVSGSIILRENANLYINGNVEIGGNVALNMLTVAGDANLNRSIFVGGDVSMNGKLTAIGDLSMNGNVTKCSFNNGSIPKSAFSSAVPDGPNYNTSKIVYDQKFQANDDVSMNGLIVAANNVKVSGNIVFGDGTVMNTADNNILSTNPKVFKSSTFTALDICGNLVAGSYATSSDYRIKTNIVELDETYTVDKLRPVKYFQTQINREKYGLIAHELQEHYPELVIGTKDGDELQRVNYTGLIAILINDIKRLKRELSELENDVVVGKVDE